MVLASRRSWTAIDGTIFHSPAEQRFYDAWRRYHPDTLIVSQARLVRVEGKPRVDFLLPATGVAVEVDGAAWHRNPEDQALDQERDKAIRRERYEVVRVWASEALSRTEVAVGRVWRAVLDRR